MTLSSVDYVASSGELNAIAIPSRAPWPIALVRAAGTAREAVVSAREIKRDLDDESPKDRARRLVEACVRLCRSMRVRVRVDGDAPTEPCVIAANHVSYIDPLAIGQTLPVGAVAKSEIKRWPGVGEAVADLGIIFVDRGCARSGALALRRMARLLDADVPVLVFPEGTTTVGEDVLPFSRGAFGIARLLGAPVVPATLRYTSPEVCWVGDDSLLPHALRLHRFDEVEGKLTFGPSLDPMAFESAAALAEATRQCIRSRLLP